MHSLAVFNPPIHNTRPGTTNLVWYICCSLFSLLSAHSIWLLQIYLPEQLKLHLQLQIHRSVKPSIETAINRKLKRKVDVLPFAKSATFVKALQHTTLLHVILGAYPPQPPKTEKL